MINIKDLRVDGLKDNSFIDNPNPHFTFYLECDIKDVLIEKIVLSLNGREEVYDDILNVVYHGEKLLPCTEYQAVILVTFNNGTSVSKKINFETTKLDTPFIARWISDPQYRFTEKKISPKVMNFRKFFKVKKKISKARIYMTAMGIYSLLINGKKIGNRYLAPGYTSYKNFLQYQCYDVTSELTGDDMINIFVSGGWAVGSFVMSRENRLANDKQALLFELLVTYEDGTEEIIVSDNTFEVTTDGPILMADIYDGEHYSAMKDIYSVKYHKADFINIRYSPKLIGDYDAGIVSHDKIEVKNILHSKKGTLIYDFGQNFAGVVVLNILKAKDNQKITIKHSEVLTRDGELNIAFLRTAKQEIVYYCKDGKQTYSPTLTYMGFRYISIEGIDENDFEIYGLRLYSNLEQIGHFECSNQMINRLHENIIASAKSNLMDIPTDCPQRDERMGWTGDICVFSPVANFNFKMGNFYRKWLNDMKVEQKHGGGIPNTIPSAGYHFPQTMMVIATDFWGDACVVVPYNHYLSTGDDSLLKLMYPTIKKYVDACAFWARLLSFGKNKYIWNTLFLLHFGDWVAPDVPKMSQWQKRSKWTATASLRNTSLLLSKVAELLGNKEDQKKYLTLSNNVKDAYISLLTDGNGKLLNEFQTAYVLPIYFDMFGDKTHLAAKNLAELVKKNDYCIGTGFPGTPYILFALADNGQVDTAYKMLLNTKCPSWLHEVKAGGTTIWERWDALDDNGECTISEDGTGGMISYNHYASGAVGDFLYRRMAGIEMIKPGYREFKIAPILGGEITSCKASTISPYGKISSNWKIENNKFILNVEVPFMTQCEVILPNGNNYQVTHGKYHYEIDL